MDKSDLYVIYRLTEMQPKLVQTQAEVEVMIVQITKDKAVAAETKAIVLVEEASASKKAAETKAIADDAQRDLDEALPALVRPLIRIKFIISSAKIFLNLGGGSPMSQGIE